jgi:type IV pilus assembly protein PilE
MINDRFFSVRKGRSAGVTLMELLIVMLVIAVLMTIAYPSYVGQVRKSKRAVAKSALLDAANRQEQYYAGNRSYADAMNKLTGYTTATVLFDADGSVTTVGTDAVYAVSVAGIDAATCGTVPCFKLQAVPQNDQANDDCGTYTITSDNTRDVSNGTSTPASECW